MNPSLMNASRVTPSAVMRMVPGSVANTMGWCPAMIVQAPPSEGMLTLSTSPR